MLLVLGDAMSCRRNGQGASVRGLFPPSVRLATEETTGYVPSQMCRAVHLLRDASCYCFEQGEYLSKPAVSSQSKRKTLLETYATVGHRRNLLSLRMTQYLHQAIMAGRYSVVPGASPEEDWVRCPLTMGFAAKQIGDSERCAMTRKVVSDSSTRFLSAT
eukprot:701767-Pyramimonas_sp.AAC.2